MALRKDYPTLSMSLLLKNNTRWVTHTETAVIASAIQEHSWTKERSIRNIWLMAYRKHQVHMEHQCTESWTWGGYEMFQLSQSSEALEKTHTESW